MVSVVGVVGVMHALVAGFVSQSATNAGSVTSLKDAFTVISALAPRFVVATENAAALAR